MSIQAHTNEVGYHSKSVFRQAISQGVYAGKPFGPEVSNYGAYVEAESWKPAPFQAIGGDRSRSYNYSRSVRRITIDQPIVVRGYEGSPSIWIPGLPNMDYTFTSWIPWERRPSAPPSVGLDNAIAQAQTQAMNKVGEANASLGAALGQVKQTVNTFSKGVITVAHGLKAIKSGQLQKLPEIFGLDLKTFNKTRGRNLSAMWLEFIYGIMPTLSDIHDAQGLIHAAIRKSYPLEGIRNVGVSESGEISEWGNYAKSKWTRKIGVRTVLKASVTSNMANDLNNAGLINPLAIGWELLPWSFLIDWFAPVGQTLEAVTAGVGLTDLGGQTTIHSVTEVNTTAVPGKYINSREYIQDAGHLQDSSFDFKRWAHTSWPRPQVFVDTTPFSTPRAVNALALVRQIT